MPNQGFTKIEILIFVLLVIIVGAVDGIVIFYLNNKEADIQVLSDISQIRSGLDEYLIKNNYYPGLDTASELNDPYAGTEKLCIEGFKRFTDKCKKEILNPVPNTYKSSGGVYTYKSGSENLSYQIEFILKTDFRSQSLKKGKNCATNSQIISQPCF
jgi:hypothetical protein